MLKKTLITTGCVVIVVIIAAILTITKQDSEWSSSSIYSTGYGYGGLAMTQFNIYRVSDIVCRSNALIPDFTKIKYKRIVNLLNSHKIIVQWGQSEYIMDTDIDKYSDEDRMTVKIP
jgi:hypothetical protein